MKRARVGLSLAVGLAIALVTVPGTAAWAQPENQQFRIIENGPPGAGGKIIAHGAFTGAGSVVAEQFVINPDGTFGGRSTFVFDEGTLTVEFEGVTPEFRFMPHGCVGVSRGITTRASVTEGTGLFEGASGSFTGSDRTVVLFERGPGGCSPAPFQVTAVIQLRGTLDLAGQAAA